MTCYIMVVNLIHCFKPKCSTFNRPTFTLNHLNIPNVNQSKYLGIVINETNCNPDLKRQMCKLFNGNYYVVIHFFGAKHDFLQIT